MFILGVILGALASWFITSILWVRRLNKVRKENVHLRMQLLKYSYTHWEG